MAKSVMECCLKWKNRYIESDLCANVGIFVLMNVCSRNLSPFHANDCVFLVMNSKGCIMSPKYKQHSEQI